MANRARVKKIFVSGLVELIKFVFRTGDCEHPDMANLAGLIKFLCSGLVTASTRTWLNSRG
jgi:hypothetical protein